MDIGPLRITFRSRIMIKPRPSLLDPMSSIAGLTRATARVIDRNVHMQLEGIQFSPDELRRWRSALTMMNGRMGRVFISDDGWFSMECYYNEATGRTHARVTILPTGATNIELTIHAELEDSEIHDIVTQLQSIMA